MEKSKYIDSPYGEEKGRGSSLPMVGSPSVAFSLLRFTLGRLYDDDSVLLSEGQPHAAVRARERIVAGAPGQTAS